MSKSIAVFGVGPGLGQAVAHRYAREGYTVVLVARRREPLDQIAKDLSSTGANAHVITADLSNTDAIPSLAEHIRGLVGHLDAFYYAPAGGEFVAAANLTPKQAMSYMPLSFYSLLALVQEFLPSMIARGEGAVLTAQGASSVQGIPNLSGPGPAQAAQRNYLQSLEAEVAGKGVYVGRLYIGAAIENTPFYMQMEEAKASGGYVPDMPSVSPKYLAGLLWTMHRTGQPEATFPKKLFDH